MSGVPTFGALTGLGQAASYASAIQQQAYNASMLAQQQAYNLASLLGSSNPYANAYRPPESEMDRRIRLANERVDHLERIFVRTMPEMAPVEELAA